jgi:hypothetical protein
MMRFHTTLVSGLAALFVVPVLIGQGEITTLQDALAGTKRALEVLKGLEQRLSTEPTEALALILSATEEPSGDEAERDRRLEALRTEVNLLQMELDASESPVLGPDGAVQSALGARTPPSPGAPASVAGITTGIDDHLRALLSGQPLPRPLPASEAPKTDADATEPREVYSADPLRHGIACYRAGRHAEAYALLAPLDDATALYWQARALERMERLDEAIGTMERAIQQGGEGFEQRRAETDLEFLRWKRDFVKELPNRKAEKPR